MPSFTIPYHMLRSNAEGGYVCYQPGKKQGPLWGRKTMKDNESRVLYRNRIGVYHFLTAVLLGAYSLPFFKSLLSSTVHFSVICERKMDPRGICLNVSVKLDIVGATSQHHNHRILYCASWRPPIKRRAREYTRHGRYLAPGGY